MVEKLKLLAYQVMLRKGGVYLVECVCQLHFSLLLQKPEHALENPNCLSVRWFL